MRSAPAGAATGAARFGLGQGELQLVLEGLDAVQADQHASADGELAAAAVSDDLVRILVVIEALAGEGLDGHQALDKRGMAHRVPGIREKATEERQRRKTRKRTDQEEDQT